MPALRHSVSIRDRGRGDGPWGSAALAAGDFQEKHKLQCLFLERLNRLVELAKQPKGARLDRVGGAVTSLTPTTGLPGPLRPPCVAMGALRSVKWASARMPGGRPDSHGPRSLQFRPA